MPPKKKDPPPKKKEEFKEANDYIENEEDSGGVYLSDYLSAVTFKKSKSKRK